VKRIAVLISSYNYQRRLNWMLSSLSQQVGISLYIEVAVLGEESGNLKTVEVVDFFKKRQGVDIRFGYTFITDPEVFTNRGITRTKQLQELKDFDSFDYFLFADCDHIYEHDFFSQVVEQAEMCVGTKTLYSVCRYSTKLVNNVNSLINAYNYPCVINRPVTTFRRAIGDENIYKTTNPGAGNCQLVHRNSILDKIYTHRKKDGGILLGSSRYPTDRLFRKRIGHHTKIEISSRQYHLQHHRVDKDQIDISTQR